MYHSPFISFPFFPSLSLEQIIPIIKKIYIYSNPKQKTKQKDKELSKTLSTADKLLRNPIESSQQKDSKKQRLKYIESLKECQQFLKIAETLRTGTKAWPSETGKLIRDYRSDTARNLVLRSRALYQLLPTVDFAGDAANDSWSVGESIFGKTWRKKLQGWAEDLGARSRCDFCRTHGGCELCLWMGKVTKPE